MTLLPHNGTARAAPERRAAPADLEDIFCLGRKRVEAPWMQLVAARKGVLVGSGNPPYTSGPDFQFLLKNPVER